MQLARSISPQTGSALNPSKPIDKSEDQQVQLNDPQVPEAVRAAASAQWREGASLWRCPRAAGRKELFNFAAQPTVVEWWLLDQRGELIEVFWES